MKKIKNITIVATLFLLLTSCAGVRNVAYFQNADQVDLAAQRMLYDAKIMPKDELSIFVNTTDPNAASPFNLNSNSQSNQTRSSNSYGNGYSLPYLVDNYGNINFPVLGVLHVEGLTKTECQEMIAGKLKAYLSETEKPIVTVMMSSYRVAVLGEVGGPGVIPVTGEKMSILEALASAGDLTIYGRRDNILLIREDARGQKTFHRLNINNADIVSSPYYYLQQNDVIYVEPNKIKARNAAIGNAITLPMTLFSAASSVASLVLLILKL